MMVSTKGRYALRVLIDLASQKDDSFISLAAISQRQEISLKYLEAIVAVLTKGGLLLSHRGAEGGYRLAKPAEKITAAEVMALTEGSLAPVSCLENGNESPCPRANQCLTRPMWLHLDGLIDSYLKTVTVRDLADGKVR